MKRILAAILAFAAITSFNACGNVESLEYTFSNHSAQSMADKGTDSSALPEGLSEEDAQELENALTAFYSAMTEQDIDLMIDQMYDRELVGYMKKYGSADGFRNMMDFTEANRVNFDRLRVRSASDADDETAKAVRVYYSSMLSTFRIMDEMNINMNDAQSGYYDQDRMAEFQEAVKDFDVMKNLDDPNAAIVLDIPEVKTVGFGGINGNDSTPVLMYKVSGEGWKIDRFVGSMMTYVKAGRQETANNAAKSISYAAMSALEDMEKDGIAISGTCIISSDSAKNKFAPECALEESVNVLTERMNYYTDLSETAGSGEYFLVFVDGACVYGVLGNGNYTGMYPVRKRMVSLGRSESSFELADPSKFTIDQLYEECSALIK